jgi:hypothetical protein
VSYEVSVDVDVVQYDHSAVHIRPVLECQSDGLDSRMWSDRGYGLGRVDAQERVYLNPELWPYLLRIGPTMDVTVYDSSIPEYTGPASCNRAPRKQR